MVFVLDKSKKPLDMITNAEARILLRNKQAVIDKVYPFTIRLKDNSCGSKDRAYTVKLDPGSKHTGIAIVDDTNNVAKLVSDTTTHDAWLTKYNRDELGLPKEHYYDALSVGEIPTKFNFITDKILVISAKGRGSRQMCLMDKFGFPRTSAKASKSVKGFQTGDIVKAVVHTGSKQGEYLGRVVVRSRGQFNIQTNKNSTVDIGYKYCRLIQRGDGYSYNTKGV